MDNENDIVPPEGVFAAPHVPSDKQPNDLGHNFLSMDVDFNGSSEASGGANTTSDIQTAGSNLSTSIEDQIIDSAPVEDLLSSDHECGRHVDSPILAMHQELHVEPQQSAAPNELLKTDNTLLEAVALPECGPGFDQPIPSIEADGDDLFGDYAEEELEDPIQDGGQAYESDPDAFHSADEDDDAPELSLTQQMAQQSRSERQQRPMIRGAFDPNSEDDSSSSDDEESSDSQMELESDEADDEHSGVENENDAEDDLFVAQEGPERNTHHAPSMEHQLDDVELPVSLSQSNPDGKNPSQLSREMLRGTTGGLERVSVLEQGYERLPGGLVRNLSQSGDDFEKDDEDEEDKRPRYTNDFSWDDDDDDGAQAMELTEETSSPAVQADIDERTTEEILDGLAAAAPVRLSLTTMNQHRKRTFTEMRDSAAPTATDLGFVLTRNLPSKRGERGVPRVPSPVQTQQTQTPAKPVSSLPMPTITLPMPSLSLPMPSIGHSTTSMHLPSQQQPRSMKDAQARMLSMMANAKRVPSLQQANATPAEQTNHASQSAHMSGAFNPMAEENIEDSLNDDSWMNAATEDSEPEIDELEEVTIKARILKQKLKKDGFLSATEQNALSTLKNRREHLLKKLSKPSGPENGTGNGNAEDNQSSDEERSEKEENDEVAELQRIKRTKIARKRIQAAEDDAIQRERERPLQIATRSRRRPRNAREVRHRDEEKQRRKEERAFFNEGKARKSKKTDNEMPAVDPNARETLFKNRLALKFDESRDEIIARILTQLNPTADAIQQRLEQGDIPFEPEIEASTKAQMLKDLISSVPADADARAMRSERANLARASRSFGFNKIKPSNGKWLLDGMQTPLFHHQLDGAEWMVSRELATKAPNGGILADAMGLGKTVTTLACICGNPPDKKSIKNRQKATLVVVPASLLAQWEAEIDRHVKSDFLGKVLVYKKKSGLKQRVVEDCDFVITTYAEVAMSWSIKMTESELQSADILGVDKWRELHRDELGVLHQINWYRIVLDEAHVIKNWKAGISQSCFHLNAQFRWCLTGTPMMNSIEELYPYFKFFRLPLSTTFADFKKAFGDAKSLDASKRLSVIIRMVMKRRTFGDTMLGRPLISLPIPSSQIKIVKLTKSEVVLYRLLEDKFRDALNVVLRQDAGSPKRNYAHMLSHLLRIRQAAAHPFLLERAIKEWFNASDLEFLKKKFERLGRSKQPLFDQVNQWLAPDGDKESAMPFGKSNFGARTSMGYFLSTVEGKGICAICQDVANRPQAGTGSCSDVFCRDCIEGAATNQRANSSFAHFTCPLCGELVGEWAPMRKASDLPSYPKNSRRSKKGDKWKPPVQSKWLAVCEKNPKWLPPSAKTIAIKALILKWRSEAPDDKIIVFTQFRAMARIIGLMLEQEKIEHTYFTGDMNQKQRQKSVEVFHTDKKVAVMIAILKCGGVGLNLSVANRVISVDIWWNHPIEQQAFGRVFRLGQLKKTHFVRLVAKSTVDYRILSLQKDKIAAIDDAMLSGKHSNLPPLSLEEIAGLFGQLVQDEDGGLQIQRDYESEEDGEDDA